MSIAGRILGLDVLVHGERECNDMVEYFRELLKGFFVTSNGWVQSYGSRCVKPTISHGDQAAPPSPAGGVHKGTALGES